MGLFTSFFARLKVSRRGPNRTLLGLLYAVCGAPGGITDLPERISLRGPWDGVCPAFQAEGPHRGWPEEKSQEMCFRHRSTFMMGRALGDAGQRDRKGSQEDNRIH